MKYHIVALNAVYQFISLSDVVCLTLSERESQWIAQSVNTHMHLRAERSLNYLSQGLSFLDAQVQKMT